MVKYKIKNLSAEINKLVKIYAVNIDGTLTPSPDFTIMDDLQKSVGIELTPAIDINCEGALTHAGIIDIDALRGSILRTSSISSVELNDEDQLLEVLNTQMGMKAVVMEEWVPEEIDDGLVDGNDPEEIDDGLVDANNPTGGSQWLWDWTLNRGETYSIGYKFEGDENITELSWTVPVEGVDNNYHSHGIYNLYKQIPLFRDLDNPNDEPYAFTIGMGGGSSTNMGYPSRITPDSGPINLTIYHKFEGQTGSVLGMHHFPNPEPSVYTSNGIAPK